MYFNVLRKHRSSSKIIILIRIKSRHAIAFDKRIALTNDPVVVGATAVSGCSPVRLTPAVGVTTGAHYRMSTGHSSPTHTHEVLISLRSNDYFVGAPFRWEVRGERLEVRGKRIGGYSSRSAIGSQWPTTPSLLGRPMPPLPPLAHAARGGPVLICLVNAAKPL